MKFSVLAIAAIPDLANAKRIHAADGLDDDAVSRILIHQRKKSGQGEQLHWTQQSIAALSMVHYSRFGVQLESLQLLEVSEKDMLQRLFDALADNNSLITWSGMTDLLPLIQFRAMINGIILPTNWNDIREGGEAHLDIPVWMAGNAQPFTDLDAVSQQLGYPGMLGREADNVWEAYMSNPASAVQFSDLRAVNTFLVALRVFASSGDLRSGTANNNAKALQEVLEQNPGEHAAEFLKAWGAS